MGLITYPLPIGGEQKMRSKNKESHMRSYSPLKKQVFTEICAVL